MGAAQLVGNKDGRRTDGSISLLRERLFIQRIRLLTGGGGGGDKVRQCLAGVSGGRPGRFRGHFNFFWNFLLQITKTSSDPRQKKRNRVYLESL